MANVIRIKRGLKANIANLTLLPGELGVTLDTQELYVGDQNGVAQIIKAGAAGSVESAEKLTTARNIAVSGDATGSASFDGSKDIEIALALANSGVTAGTYNNVTVNSKGIITSATNKVYTIEDIDGLQTALNAKVAASTYNTDMATINGNFETINTELGKKANSTDVYTKTEVDTKIDAKDSLPSQTGNAGKYLTTNGTTASWSEIDLSSKADVDNVYTKTETNNLLSAKADVSALNSAKSELQTNIDKKATSATTLAGYGIENAYTKDEVDGMISGTFHFEGEVDSYDALPSNAEKGDVYQVGDKEYAWDGDSWIELGFNIDLSAYAKTVDVAKDYATKTELSNAQTALQNNINTKANVSDVTELSTKVTNVTMDLGNLTQRVDSISIPTKVSELENDKNYAVAATTLSGYGITNAYTKTEVDNKETALNNAINSKLGIDSVIDGGTFDGTGGSN